MRKYTITKRKAIRESLKMWKLIAASRLDKCSWLRTAAAAPFLHMYKNDCPLCEYTESEGRLCSACPLYLQLGTGCISLGYLISPEGFYAALRKLKS